MQTVQLQGMVSLWDGYSQVFRCCFRMKNKRRRSDRGVTKDMDGMQRYQTVKSIPENKRKEK